METTSEKSMQQYPIEEYVYYSLQGALCDPHPGVENAFAPGSICEKSYSDMLDAYGRLCARLGVQDEDKDVEVIINSLQTITEELCYRMFTYGAKLSHKDLTE